MATKMKNTERPSNVHEVKPENIHVIEGFNKRIEYGDMDDLKASIRVNGVLDPLTVVQTDGDHVDLFDGYRRLKAVQELIEEGVPIEAISCRVLKKGTTHEEGMIKTIVSSNGGKKHEPIELAEFYQQLINWGWTQIKIAERIGKSQAHVSNTLVLLETPEVVKSALASGEVSQSEVKELIKESRTQDDPAQYQRDKVAEKQKEIADNGGKKKRKPRTPKPKNGTNPAMVKVLKEEFFICFPDPNKYHAFIKRHEHRVFTNEENDLFNAGRISLACELVRDGATAKDLFELLGNNNDHQNGEPDQSLEIGVEDLDINDELATVVDESQWDGNSELNDISL